MDTNTLLLVGGAGAVVYFLMSRKARAATPATAPSIGTVQATEPGQVPTGNPLASILVGLAAGIAGSRMTQTR